MATVDVTLDPGSTASAGYVPCIRDLLLRQLLRTLLTGIYGSIFEYPLDPGWKARDVYVPLYPGSTVSVVYKPLDPESTATEVQFHLIPGSTASTVPITLDPGCTCHGINVPLHPDATPSLANEP